MTGAQLRMVYMLRNECKLDDDTLHDVVRGITGKDSLKALTSAEGGRVIDRLQSYCNDIPNRATQKQRWLIKRIEMEMGWADEPQRLRGMIQRVTGVNDLKFLTVQQARKVIEALKAMQGGNRTERKP